ncbi:hypothetical protein IAU68_10960 [Corynebacterium lujinxingii]|uniref:Serine protease n=1 Tax=Corynebacterium lujinxingii TaxID=2763010 RepID=A0A7H0JYN2_9CORY|nr:hypothetical protein [Corynebacterium lujinxingii]QNP90148.1 hypothetical protein IAU68_10960 [Corynebacterium lujinxingii]
MFRRARRRLSAAVAATVLSLTASFAAAAPAAAYDVYGGDLIYIKRHNGTLGQCTLNSVARRGGALYGITSGHCMPGAAKVLASDRKTPIASNLADSGYINVGSGLNERNDDIGWFRLDPHVKDAHAMRGGSLTAGVLGVDTKLVELWRSFFPVRGVAGRAPVTAVRPGTIVCKDGGRTGRTCGPVLSVRAGSGEIIAVLPSATGDSGAPVYMTGPGGKAVIVGVLSGAGWGRTLADAVQPLPAGLH